MCLEGGIAIAAGVDHMHGVGSFLLDSCPAARAVHSYLGLSHSEELWEWNDRSLGFCRRRGLPIGSSHDRDASEVIEVLRATALIEEAKEDASVSESVAA